MDASGEPADDAVLRPFLQSTARDALSMPFCDRCGAPVDIDQRRCESCGAGAVCWRIVEPRGRVAAATMMHRRDAGVMADSRYAVVEVELLSGHRLITSTASASDHAFQAGEPVALEMVRVGDRNIPRITVPTRLERSS
jgi:uncharacterized OB-fold protein